jgi:uncharacterized membrane protein
VTSRMHEAKHPKSGLSGPYGHPFHPMLVTVPIGAWIASLVFDIGSRLSDNAAFLAKGSVWLIAIGVVGALAAATVGFVDFLGIPAGTKAFLTARIHMGLNLAVTIAYVVNFVWRLSGYDDATEVSVGQLLLSIASLVALAASGYLGGELAYHYGVRVADEGTQAQGYGPDPAQPRDKV